jgi:NTE family protein
MQIGLALSGGGARGVAHLGMIQALEDHGIHFDRITGASAGAIVGAFYASGYAPREILEIVLKTNFLKILKPALNWRGLLKLENAAAEMSKYFQPDSFESLKKPLTVAATNLTSGRITYFNKGPLIRPVLASCSIPVVFDPIEIEGNQYIDGGILDNLPILPLKNCNRIVGMHCNSIGPDFKPASWRDLMERSLLMAITTTTQDHKKKCDLVLEPPKMSAFRVFDFKKAREMFDIGYHYGAEKVKHHAVFGKMIREDKHHD